MNDWYELFLGQGEVALLTRTKIQQDFLIPFAVAGEPDSVAIFASTETKEDGAQEATLYFSPAAVKFAKSIPGTAPCEKPSPTNLSLEVGNSPGAFHALFPDTD